MVLLPFALGGGFLLNLVGVPGPLSIGLAAAWFVGTGAAELALLRRPWHWALRSLAAPVIFVATSILTVYLGGAVFIPPAWTTNKATMRVTKARLAIVAKDIDRLPDLGVRVSKAKTYGCSEDSGDVQQPNIERDWNRTTSRAVAEALAGRGWQSDPPNHEFIRTYGSWKASAYVSSYEGDAFVIVRIVGLRPCKLRDPNQFGSSSVDELAMEGLG